MSKKKMLEEAQIRRMFQLAGMPAIGEGFIGGKYADFANEEQEAELAEEDSLHEGEPCPNGCNCNQKNEEKVAEGGMKYSREEDEEEEMSEGGMKYSREEEGDEEEPSMDMGAEEPAADMGDMGGEGMSQDKVEAIVDAVLAGIQQETGVPLERVPSEGGEAEAGDMGGEDEPMADAGEEEGEDDLALEQDTKTSQFDEEVIEEVSRRVARKLIQLTRKNK